MNKLSIPLSFLTVIIIWSTTPLALKWSSVTSPMSSATIRMALGVLFCALMMAGARKKLPFDRLAQRIYLACGLSIFGGMSLMYWAAQSVPSGWISVIFGLSPIFTGLLSAIVEPNTKLTSSRIAGILLGFTGLFLVFKAGLSFNESTLQGIILLVISVFIASSSAVIIRQLNLKRNLTGMQTSTGGLIVAVPLFAITAIIFEPISQVEYSNRAIMAILYLGIIGSGIGFTLYYFLLNHVSADKVSLVTLITPISALLIGTWFNNEPVITNIWLGGICVCIGLLLYQYKPRLGLRKL